MNKYLSISLLMGSFLAIMGCTRTGNPLCQKWRCSDSSGTIMTKGKDGKLDNNGIGNLGAVSIQYNNDGTYEEVDMASFSESSKSEGTWRYTRDKKGVIETNGATGHIDTFFIVNLSYDHLVLKHITPGDTTTNVYNSD